MAGRSPILAVKIIADSQGFTKGLDQAEGKLAGFGKKLAGAFAAIGVGAFVADAIKGAEAAAQANAKVEQILSTNVKASQQQIDATLKSAEALSKSIAVDDEVIKAGQAILGTFKSVATSAGEVGGVFERATVSAADLAAAGFGSIESNSVALGKALENPTKGLTALTKSGVTFTEAQKEQIKAMQAAGDMAGAQGIILKAIEDQVGGTAEASVTASQKMAYTWGELTEGIGGLLLPAFEAVAGVLTDKVMPAVQGFVGFIKSGDLTGLADALNIDPSSLDWLTTVREKFIEFGDYLAGHRGPRDQDVRRHAGAVAGRAGAGGRRRRCHGARVPGVPGRHGRGPRRHQGVRGRADRAQRGHVGQPHRPGRPGDRRAGGRPGDRVQGVRDVPRHRQRSVQLDQGRGRDRRRCHPRGLGHAVRDPVGADQDRHHAHHDLHHGYIAVVKGVFGAIRDVWDKIADVLSGPISSAKNAISGVLDTVGGLFSSAKNQDLRRLG